MTTLYVKKDGSGTHTEIQSAIYDSVNGDQISIEAGLFDENIDLYKAVSLTGAGMALTTVNGTFKTAVSLSGVRTFYSNVVILRWNNWTQKRESCFWNWYCYKCKDSKCKF